MAGPRIGIYGPFGWGNLGDAAIQESMLEGLRRRHPGASALGISLNPTNTAEIHGIDAVPILRRWRPPAPTPDRTGPGAPDAPGAPDPRPARTWKDLAPVRALKALLHPIRPALEELRFCARNLRTLAGLDALIVSGGGQVSDDWGGPWDHPWSMFSWCLCARLAGTPVAIVSVGAGPIDSPLSRWFFFRALRLARYRSVRDVESLEFLRAGGCALPVEVYPDLAFAHPLPGDASPGDAGPVVGVSPMSYFHPQPGVWPEQDGARYERHIETLARFTGRLVDEGRPVSLFTNQVRNDRFALTEVLARLQGRAVPAGEPTRDLPHLLAQIAAVDVVVTSRLHGVILSFLQGKPVIALSYESKIDAVMRQFGQERFRLDIDQVTPERLEGCFAELLEGIDGTRARIAATAASHRSRLEEQFDRLFGARGVLW